MSTPGHTTQNGLLAYPCVLVPQFNRELWSFCILVSSFVESVPSYRTDRHLLFLLVKRVFNVSYLVIEFQKNEIYIQ